MIAKTLRHRRKLFLLGRGRVGSMIPTSKVWVLVLVVIVGLLTKLGFPAWFMMYTLIDGNYLGQMELTIEPEGSIHLKMDNRQDSSTLSKKQQTKQPAGHP
jgi:hypothetical protein